VKTKLLSLENNAGANGTVRTAAEGVRYLQSESLSSSEIVS
jgi:hypothetical protein